MWFYHREISEIVSKNKKQIAQIQMKKKILAFWSGEKMSFRFKF